MAGRGLFSHPERYSMSAPAKVLNAYGMTKTQGEWSSLFVLLSVMQSNDAAHDAANVSIQAVIDALDPEDNAAEITALQSVQTSLSTTDVLTNGFAEVLRRLAPWKETFFMRDVATLFGDKVSR